MPTTIKTKNFNTLTAASPYVIGSAPDNLFGYALTTGSDPVKIFNTGSKELILASGTRAILYDTTNMTGVTIRSTIKMGNVNGNNRGGGVVDAAGNGYVFITNNVANNFRIYKTVANVPTTLIYTSPTLTPVIDNNYTLDRNTTTGVMKLFDNAGTQIGVDSPADLTYPNARFACCYMEYGYVRALTSEYTPAQTITSINGGNPVTAGQQNIPIVATGFTEKPTGATVTYQSVVTPPTFATLAAIIAAGGTKDAFPVNLQDRINAEDWPLFNSTATFAFTYLAESASKNHNILGKSGDTALTYFGAITDDDKSLAYHLAADGFTPEGGEIVYSQPPATATMPTPNLVLKQEGGWTVKEPCTFETWFRPATGFGAGNVFYYRWVTNDAGALVIDNSPTADDFGAVTNCEKLTYAYATKTITVLDVTPDTDIPVVAQNGMEYRVNTGSGFGAWTAANTNVRLNYIIDARMLSANLFSTPKTGKLVVGGVDMPFTATTRAINSIPNAVILSWPTDGVYICNPFTIQGVDEGANVSVVVGTLVNCTAEYSINNGTYTAANGVAHLDDDITVKLTVSDPNAVTPNATLLIGGVPVVLYAPVNSHVVEIKNNNFIAKFM